MSSLTCSRANLLSVLAVAIFIFPSCTSRGRLERDDWAPEVKEALNQFVDAYAGADDAYVVTDFDNTSCIFDIQEQAWVWQLETMCFPLTPEKFRELAVFDPGDSELNRSKLSSVEVLCEDYAELYGKYGPFGVKPRLEEEGVSRLDGEYYGRLHADEVYKDFTTRMMLLLDDLPDIEGDWAMRFLAGFTTDELYDFCRECYERFSKVESFATHFSNAVDSIDFVNGITVSKNVIELWNVLKANDIDVWVCSASEITQVRAALDVFGLHDLCSGVIAKTFKTDADGRLTAEYDYESGYPFVPVKEGWKEDRTNAIGASPKSEGKVAAIENVLRPMYGGKAPLAGFMDSTGDFNFCTEYKDMRLVVCYNRGTREVTDGGGLISEVALYQRDALGLDFRTTLEKGETLYLLQGRDENGHRTLRASNSTLRFICSEESCDAVVDADGGILFSSAENRVQLDWMASSGLSTGEILDSLCLFTPASESHFGFEYGWLDSYSGYHSR